MSSPSIPSESESDDGTASKIDFTSSFDPTQPTTALNGAGLTCEIKNFESLYTTNGVRRLLQAGSTNRIEREHYKQCFGSALIFTKFWKFDRTPDRTELEIRSPYMKAALQAVVPLYRTFNIHVKHIMLRDEPRCLFHFRQELQAYGAGLQDAQEAKHVLFLLQYMYNTLSAELYTFFTFMENPNTAPALDFLNLWMAFREGDLVFLRDSSRKARGRGRVCRFESMGRCRCEVPICADSQWTIRCHNIAYDGETYGHKMLVAHIRPYDGFRKIQDLLVFPLRYHPHQVEVQRSLVQRGEKLTRLHGRHYKSYNGIASLLGGERLSSFLGEEDEFPLQDTMVKGRIIVDEEACYEARPSHSPSISRSMKRFDPNKDEHLHMEDEEYLICTDEIAGYSLDEKKWGFFKVDLINDIDFDINAFDSLLLNEQSKMQILSLVTVHEDEGVQFDDFVKGKGRGMVFLFHGDPGVGKTLAAESVADHCRKPLLRIDACSLGTTAVSVEQGLSAAFRFAEKWHAIALLDEADVFLEQRRISDISRNSLVSVFLRILEYYQGILFLTTNRIGVFDQAFKSRIHLAIRFPSLSQESRRSLWGMFLSKVSHGREWVDENANLLDALAAEELNGRQIKNSVRTAAALAISQKSVIRLEHINAALEAMKAFGRDFDIQATQTGREDGDCQDENETSKGTSRVKRRRLDY